MQTTDYLLLGILLLSFGGISLLGNVLLPYEWAVITLWLGFVVGIGGVIINEFEAFES
ncbi:hypothetical protein SAMN05421858_2577 [Haladaptatus litoreus]|uniref:Uncharacterized protein n=1 Tax=Haladaptatus litoreus TaxID=553468 RepID=A0A1N7BIZ8_9EURY|nr:hypothetical protein [Haladaptatus litoreus]SIR51173.1 hypothetical protein SAMN05421858_2577 [Haladaptatus litoreus]